MAFDDLSRRMDFLIKAQNKNIQFKLLFTTVNDKNNNKQDELKVELIDLFS